MREARLLLRGCLLLLVLAGGSGCRSDALPPQGGPAERHAAPDDLQLALLAASEHLMSVVNARRAESGALPLLPYPALSDLAFERATDMGVRGYLGHVDPQTGENLLETRLAEQGFTGPAAELLYETPSPLQDVADQALETWWQDPAHRTLLMEPAFRFAGVGLMGDGSEWRVVIILTVKAPDHERTRSD